MSEPGPALTPVDASKGVASASVTKHPPLVASLLRVIRPKQWSKNLAIFAPLVFAQKLLQPQEVTRSVLAFASFCLLAGSVYVLNDSVDREKDRLHPEKRHRPIASGALPLGLAFAWGLICMAIALGTAWATNPDHELFAVELGYLLLQVAYSLKLKAVAVLDVMMIAVGFVIRVVAGAAAISVPVSNWLYLCTLCLALFLGFCKRRHELTSLSEGASAHRANLADYSEGLLDQLIGTTTAMTLISYSLYTMSPETIEKFHTDNLRLTIPFVFYGVFRYLYIVYKLHEGGSPERILVKDAPMLTTVVLYVLVAVAVLYRGAGT